MLNITTDLKIKPQQKLKILRLFIPSQLSFDLGIYNISYTWIVENLDSVITNSIRDWLELPVSTCVVEIASLPASFGGLDIPSLKDTAEKLRLSQRYKLHRSHDEECQSLWKLSSESNVNLDSIIVDSTTQTMASRNLKTGQNDRKLEHVNSLSIQGKLIAAINTEFNRTDINKWTWNLEKLAAPLFKFVRKALQQQLPTAANLHRWGKTTDPSCPLCQQYQTNKHVLSNCGSMIALERYKTRHDSILKILADWICKNLKTDCAVFVDLDDDKYKPLSDLFQSQRPDIAILGPSGIDTLELTVCHETNLSKSKLYKQTRYANLNSNVNDKYANLKIIYELYH